MVGGRGECQGEGDFLLAQLFSIPSGLLEFFDITWSSSLTYTHAGISVKSICCVRFFPHPLHPITFFNDLSLGPVEGEWEGREGSYWTLPNNISTARKSLNFLEPQYYKK